MQNKDIEDLINKRMQTIMIGALARFEENFAYLWTKETTHTQYFLDLWQRARQDVLDYGNNQIRLAKKELEQMEDRRQTKYKYRYRFDMRRNNNNEY